MRNTSALDETCDLIEELGARRYPRPKVGLNTHPDGRVSGAII
jgi:hypothetical protein